MQYRITTKSASCTVRGKVLTFRAGTPEYDRAVQSAEDNDWKWLTMPNASRRAAAEGRPFPDGAPWFVRDGQLFITVDGVAEQTDVAFQRWFRELGEPQALVEFWRKLSRQPNELVRSQLFAHVERCGFSIRPDGDLVFYKSVVSDGDKMWSWYDRSFRYEFGKVARPTNGVDLDPRVSCGRGLHSCPYGDVHRVYGNYPIIEVDTSPEDVLSIPMVHGCNMLRSRTLKPVRWAPRDPRHGMLAPAPAYETKLVLESTAMGVQDVYRVATPARVGRFTVEAGADGRVSLPFTRYEDCGFTDRDAVLMLHTDPRSRFMLLCRRHPDPVRLQRMTGLLKRDNFTWSKEASARKGVSIRATSLASCGIAGHARYGVECWEVNGARYALLRPE